MYYYFSKVENLPTSKLLRSLKKDVVKFSASNITVKS